MPSLRGFLDAYENEGGATPPLGCLSGTACRAEDRRTTKPAHQEAREMLTTNIRTSIIALVAASGFAAASVAPAVSQAQTFSVKQAQERHCGRLQDSYNRFMKIGR